MCSPSSSETHFTYEVLASALLALFYCSRAALVWLFSITTLCSPSKGFSFYKASSKPNSTCYPSSLGCRVLPKPAKESELSPSVCPFSLFYLSRASSELKSTTCPSLYWTCKPDRSKLSSPNFGASSPSPKFGVSKIFSLSKASSLLN